MRALSTPQSVSCRESIVPAVALFLSPLAVATLLFLAVLSFAGCGDHKRLAPPEDPGPKITSMQPDSVEIGAQVEIEGAHFGANQEGSKVHFGTREATVALWSDQRILATVPATAIDDSLYVEVDARTSNKIPYSILEPVVALRLDKLQPARTTTGDIITIWGTGFDGRPGAPEMIVTFSGPNGRIRGQITVWTPTSLRSWVPVGAVDGTVQVEIAGRVSNEVPFSVAPTRIAYTAHVKPILQARGCVDCHGPDRAEAGLRVDTALGILNTRSTHAPVVVRWDSAQSLLIQKLGPNPPFGDRMPKGCTECVTDAEILTLRDWIDQGAPGY